MKKIVKLLIFVFVFASVFSLSSISVKAADDIDTVIATGGTQVIAVSGTTQTGVLAVAILVYDESGTTLQNMYSAAVNDSNTYSANVAMPAGTYLVRVSNYNGGTYKESSVVTVTAPAAPPASENQNNSTSTTPAVTPAETQTVAPVAETPEPVAPVQTVSPKTNDGMEIILFVAIFAAIAFAGYAVRKRV